MVDNCPPQTDTLDIKTGSSAEFIMVYEVPNPDTGELEPVLNISVYEIFINFINSKTGKLIKSCFLHDGSIYYTGEQGEYGVNAGSTRDWPIGKMSVDILYTTGGSAETGRQHTTTFYLNVIRGLSQYSERPPDPPEEPLPPDPTPPPQDPEEPELPPVDPDPGNGDEPVSPDEAGESAVVQEVLVGSNVVVKPTRPEDPAFPKPGIRRKK